MPRPLRCFLLFMALAGLLAPTPAGAHPSNEASIYHYLYLVPKPGRLELQHGTLVGGLVVQQYWPKLDPDGDLQLSKEEQERYARGLAARLELEIDGKAVPWKLDDWQFPSHVEFFGGTLVPVALSLTAPLPTVPAKGVKVTVRDSTYPEILGVFPPPDIKAADLGAGQPEVSEDGRTVTVAILPRALDPGRAMKAPAATTGTATGATKTAPKFDPANPAASLNGPGLDQKPIFEKRGGVVLAGPRREPGESEQLKGFLRQPLTPGLLLLALGTALILGAAHALSPGHGKSMVGAYLVGSRGTVGDAVILGLVVTVTHTASIYLLGFLCLWLTTRIDSQVVGHWLSLLSGVLVLGMGFWMFQRGLLAYYGLAQPPSGHAHGPGGHSHGAPPTMDHGPSTTGHGHTYDHGHAHDHVHEHTHSHEHGHAHASPSTFNLQPSTAPDRSPPRDSPLEDAAKPVVAQRRDRWGVIGLGIAGGMTPCFDALAVLIAAVNLGQIPLGLLLIFAFSVGMALVLVAIGVLMVTARSRMERFTGQAPWVRALPAVSGGVLFFLGAWLTLNALADAGWIKVGSS